MIIPRSDLPRWMFSSEREKSSIPPASLDFSFLTPLAMAEILPAGVMRLKIRSASP